MDSSMCEEGFRSYFVLTILTVVNYLKEALSD